MRDVSQEGDAERCTKKTKRGRENEGDKKEKGKQIRKDGRGRGN